MTLDGSRVELLANIELPDDAAAALEAGAIGVGLFRTEFLFMNRDGELPGEDEQFEAYRSAVAAHEGPAGDDPHASTSAPTSRSTGCRRTSCATSTRSNPALGLRAIRWSLSEPEMFRHAAARDPARGALRQGAAS